MLLSLPKLHALQLAGAQNKWRCDCRLRKLVRLLLYNAGARGATGQTILQDAPRCHQERQAKQQASWPANDAHDGAQPGPSWTGHSNGTLGGKSIRLGDSIVKAGRQEPQEAEEEDREDTTKNGAKAAKVTRSTETNRNEAATSNEQTTIRHSRLNAARHRRRRRRSSADDDEDDHQDRHGRLWTSMSKYPQKS